MSDTSDLHCARCGKPIAVGQHYIRLQFALDTPMPEGYKPARQLEPEVHEAVFDLPPCAARWIIAHPVMTNVFAH